MISKIGSTWGIYYLAAGLAAVVAVKFAGAVAAIPVLVFFVLLDVYGPSLWRRWRARRPPSAD